MRKIRNFARKSITSSTDTMHRFNYLSITWVLRKIIVINIIPKYMI